MKGSPYRTFAAFADLIVGRSAVDAMLRFESMERRGDFVRVLKSETDEIRMPVFHFERHTSPIRKTIPAATPRGPAL